jgi:hypothetical protein
MFLVADGGIKGKEEEMNTFLEKHANDIKIQLNTPKGEGIEEVSLYIPVNTLYASFHTWLHKLMQPGNAQPEVIQTSKLIKAAVKGVLIVYGDKLLSQMIGKDHPRPGKNDDIVEWYTDMFAKIAITLATKNIYTVETEVDNDTFTKVSRVTTIPVPVKE